MSTVPAIPGATYRQLDHWCRRGWLLPGVGTPGSGAARDWPPEEIAIATTMVRLVAAGMEPAAAAVVARVGDPTDGPIRVELPGRIIVEVAA